MANFFGATPMVGQTPVGGMDMATPGPGQAGAMTPEQFHALRWEREIEERNRPLADDELDAMLPPDGFKILDPPAGYKPIYTPARKLMATPAPMGGATPLYSMPEEHRGQTFDLPMVPEGLPDMKPEDYQVRVTHGQTNEECRCVWHLCARVRLRSAPACASACAVVGPERVLLSGGQLLHSLSRC